MPSPLQPPRPPRRLAAPKPWNRGRVTHKLDHPAVSTQEQASRKRGGGAKPNILKQHSSQTSHALSSSALSPGSADVTTRGRGGALTGFALLPRHPPDMSATRPLLPCHQPHAMYCPCAGFPFARESSGRANRCGVPSRQEKRRGPPRSGPKVGKPRGVNPRTTRRPLFDQPTRATVLWP